MVRRVRGCGVRPKVRWSQVRRRLALRASQVPLKAGCGGRCSFRKTVQSRELGVRTPAKTFGDIPWRRRGSVPDLFSEPKILFALGPIRQAINTKLQLVRDLPAMELPKVSRASHAANTC